MREPLHALPTDTDLLDALLRSPAPCALTEHDIAALRALEFRTNTTMMDISSGIQKAELLHASQPENAETAKNAETIIADQMAAAVATRVFLNSELRRILGPNRYRLAFRAAEVPGKKQSAAIVNDAERASKDQKAVEIETAVLVAERLVSWAKLFAWLVAVPAALVIAILTIIGISKFSDFTTLARNSEEKLKLTVAQATTSADTFAKKVADLAEKQKVVDQRLATLSTEVKNVADRIAFAQGTVTPDAQKLLEAQFNKFQDFIVGLGYVPAARQIRIKLLADGKAGLAYYSEGTIFVSREAAGDPEVIYREYLHHVLGSKSGNANLGPERSALESGLADYLVASYAGSPRIYQKSFGKPKDLEVAKNIRPAVVPEDRFPVGDSWAFLFFHLHQSIGREQVDKAVFNAWFDLPTAGADRALPTNMIARLLERIAPGPNNPNRALFLKIVQQHGAPTPASP